MKNANISEISYKAIKQILSDGHFKDISFLKIATISDTYKQSIVHYMVNKSGVMSSFFQQYGLRQDTSLKELVKFVPYMKTLDKEAANQFNVLIERVKTRFDSEQDFCGAMGSAMLANLGL